MLRSTIVLVASATVSHAFVAKAPVSGLAGKQRHNIRMQTPATESKKAADDKFVPIHPTSFDKEGLLRIGRGEVFGKDNARLPLPPMLMMDRITDVSADGGANSKGHVVAEFDIHPEQWFFPCHFDGDPIMPGCLGLDALWQLTGFNLAWRGWQGKGYALGVGKVEFTGMVRPDRKLLRYEVDFTKTVNSRRLTMGVADGKMYADDELIYNVYDMKVAFAK